MTNGDAAASSAELGFAGQLDPSKILQAFDSHSLRHRILAGFFAGVSILGIIGIVVHAPIARIGHETTSGTSDSDGSTILRTEPPRFEITE